MAALKKECQEKIAELSSGLTSAELDYKSVLQLRKNVNMYSNPLATKHYQELLLVCSQIRDYKRTIEVIDQRTVQTSELFVTTESATVSSEMTDGLVSTMEVTENVTDITGDQEVIADAFRTDYSVQGQKNLLGLDNFFSRPIQLAAGKLLNGTYTSIMLPVWDTYTLNPAVRAKLRNYAFFKADLHVRIVVSGTPYHYGKMMISYQPYDKRNQNLIDLNTQFGVSVSFRPNMISYLSQAPGAQTLDIRENKPIEVVCPFISTKNAHRLYNTASTVISDVTSYQDLQEAGSIYFWSINPASVINATTDAARYYIYAWAENVELGPPTGTHIDIRTESFIYDSLYNTEVYDIYTESDEREVGPVEKFSSTAKRVSQALEVVPEIGIFATASKIGFGALEAISSLFGWSKPVLIDTPVFVKNAAYQNGALTVGTDTNFRIVLDPKQELTVDPRVTGGCEDEMALNYISAIPAYLVTFEWIPDDVPMTPLFTSAVNPSLSAGISYNNYLYTQQSPMAFVSHFFESWRGDIEFTFEVVCSQFHRGKLAVIYEPNMNQSTLINSGLDLNRQYVKIIDIQETQTITFKVNWGSTRSWLSVPSRYETATQQYTGTGAITQLGDNAGSNGYITVVPITDLISPDNGTVEVNVYVKCPNLMVNGFTNRDLVRNRNLITESAIDTRFYSTQQVSLMDLNESVTDIHSISLEHYGERPLSFRALLKRYATDSTIGNSLVGANAARIVSVTRNIIPLITAPYGSSNISQTVRRDLFGELRYAYLGMRGGVRHQVALSSDTPLMQECSTAVRFMPIESTNAVVATSSNITSTSGYLELNLELNGSVNFVLSSNGGLEVELPYYSQNRFSFAFADNDIGSNPGGDQNMTTLWRKRVEYSVGVNESLGPTALWFVFNVAAGEDFSFLRYQGAPHFRSIFTIV